MRRGPAVLNRPFDSDADLPFLDTVRASWNQHLLTNSNRAPYKAKTDSTILNLSISFFHIPYLAQCSPVKHMHRFLLRGCLQPHTVFLRRSAAINIQHLVRPWQQQGNKTHAPFVKSLLIPTLSYPALLLVKMMDQNLLGIQGLLFTSQNVNSLNLSTFHNNSIAQCKFSSKIISILSKSPDIAFLQDVRLKNKEHILHNFIRCTKYGNYKALTNSNLGSGGVAILYNSRLDLDIISTYKSPCQNIL